MPKLDRIPRHLAYYGPLVILISVWMFAVTEPGAPQPAGDPATGKAEHRAPVSSATPDSGSATPPAPADRDIRLLVADKVAADRQARAGAGENLPADFLDRIVNGKAVSFRLPDGSDAVGTVEMIERDAKGVLFVQGRLTKPGPGSYFLQRQTVEGVAGPFVGNVRFDDKQHGWKLEPTPDFKASRFVPRKLDEILCVNYSELPAPVEEQPDQNT